LFRRWQRDRTWARILARLQAHADVAGRIGWEVSVDSTAYTQLCLARHLTEDLRRPSIRYDGTVDLLFLDQVLEELLQPSVLFNAVDADRVPIIQAWKNSMYAFVTEVGPWWHRPRQDPAIPRQILRQLGGRQKVVVTGGLRVVRSPKRAVPVAQEAGPVAVLQVASMTVNETSADSHIST
jgi:hypothetical protein